MHPVYILQTPLLLKARVAFVGFNKVTNSRLAFYG